jgi:cytochrome P450
VEVFSYTENRQVLSNAAHFPSTFPGSDGKPFTAGLILQDPPYHAKLRSVVNPAFTPKAVARHAPYIRAVAHELLEHAIRRGEMDLLADVAVPLAERVIIEHLGLPQEDRRYIFHIAKSIFHVSPEFARYSAGIFRQLQQKASQSIISGLLEAQIDEHKLGLKELTAFMHKLLVTGRDTVAYIICNSMYCLSAYPEIMETLRTHPTLIPGAFEEVLRLYPSFPRVRRTVLGDTQVGRQHIQAGQMVLCLLDKANRDETQFSNPDVFDMKRVPNKHLSFGYGEHFCVGAALGRLEAQIALEVMMERLVVKKIQRETPPAVLPGGLFGLNRLLVM